MKKIIEMSRNYNYTTGKLLDYLNYQKYFEPIVIDLSFFVCGKYIRVFLNKLRKKWWCDNVFIAERQQKIILNFSLDSLILTK